MSFHINILTLFPDMFPGPLGQSLSGKALERGDWSYQTVNIRDYGHGVHKAVDDTPYGGGAGMIMRADILEQALLSLSLPPSPSFRRKPESPAHKQQDPVLQRDDENTYGRRIYLSPRGKPLTQPLVQELAQEETLTLLCGRYEGVDERFLDAHGFEEISIGDYVLSGGEPAALILMDACIRLLPGVMGNDDTAGEESFSPETGGLLEYPHYTRPAAWTAANGETYNVPEILTSGDHAKIKNWRRTQSEAITKDRRPDLLKKD